MVFRKNWENEKLLLQYFLKVKATLFLFVQSQVYFYPSFLRT